MDQLTFGKLTGIALTDEQAERFDSVSAFAGQFLEDLLGWPLDPSDWGEQYVETGKTQDDGSFSCDADIDDLDAPDAVAGSYRLYPWRVSDRFIHIDPATAIHAVKLVKDGITFKTFETEDYQVKWENGKIPTARFVQLCEDCFCACSCRNLHTCRMVAVDADWAYGLDADDVTVLPLDLQKVWADLIWNEMDEKRDVKSESITSHSYAKYDRQEPERKYAAVLRKYLGPRGTLKRPNIT